MKKSELLNWLHEEYQKWEALLDQIGTASMDQPSVNGDWPIKDIVAHLTGWQRRVVANLQAAPRGETALETAKRLAGDKDIGIACGNIAQQFIIVGLVGFGNYAPSAALVAPYNCIRRATGLVWLRRTSKWRCLIPPPAPEEA